MGRCIQQSSACKESFRELSPHLGGLGLQFWQSELGQEHSSCCQELEYSVVDRVVSCLDAVLNGVSGESSLFWHAGIGEIALASLATR